MSLKALSEYTIVSRYALFNKEKGRRETWEESVSRVFDMHRKKYANEISKFPELGEAIDFAQKMQTKKRVLASQRSLQFAGDPILRHPLKIFNCLFSHIDRQRVFQEIMYSLLCGCGVGFSAQDQHVAKLSDIGPIDSEQKEVFVIPDSIEGWADSIGVLMGSYFCGVNEFSSYRGKNVEFDFSQIRPKGSLIAGQFKAPGPDGLRKTLEKIRDLLNERLSLFSGTCPLRPIDCYDIIMHISDAVLSGGVRRAATLCLFSHNNQEMMTAKTGNWFNDNPQRARSNNSAALLKGSTTREEFSILMKSTKEFGEPAFIWLDDLDVGYNPCCVTGDTRVGTNQGDVKIKDLIDRYEIEDIKVLSYNIKEDRVEYKNIIAGKLTRRDAELVKITTSNNVQLTCTPDHKIYTLNRGYVQAQDLICDDDLDGDSIWSVEYLDRVEDTYDIEVEDNHNFYANGILVHNCEIGMHPKTSDGRSGFSACNLTEINGKYCDTKDNFLMACEASAIIGTLQAGYTNIEYLSKESREIFENEALLGCSITGMMDNPNLLFDPKIQQEAAKFILEVNANIAKMIGINPAARATCVKPAGCQNKETLVSTDEGILRLDEIGDLNGGEWQAHSLNVHTDKGLKNSGKFYINGFAKTKKILLDSGLTLEATLNHKYRILDDQGNYIWKSVCDLKPEDIMPYSIGEYTNSENRIKLTKIHYKFHKATPKYQIKYIKQPEIICEDLAWFLGLYYGDGSNHKSGIRIAVNWIEKKGAERLTNIIKDIFDIDVCLQKETRPNHNGGYVGIHSGELVSFLSANNLLKEKAHEICIPEQIRRSSINIINSFIDGFAVADGCDKSRTRSFSTTSKQMAEELVVVLRAIGKDAKMRLMPPTESSYGNRMRYWVQERKSLSGNTSKISNYRKDYIDILRKNGLNSHLVDKIVEISDSENYTYDIEVDETRTYISNSYISHNSSSCILGTSSGIHPHHSKKYIRRVQANKSEFCLETMEKFNPLAVEESVWSSGGTDKIVSFLCEVPVGSIVKNQLGAVELLEKVKLTQNNWVEYGTRKELCSIPSMRHNVSNTITVKPEEWDDVEKFIFDNQQWFAGISLLPSSGDLDYAQAPFSTVLTPSEIVREYGEGSVFASGLIVDALAAFKGNLWVACENSLNGDISDGYPACPSFKLTFLEKANVFFSKNKQRKIIKERADQYRDLVRPILAKSDWVRRATQFSDRYFGGDTKRMTYCLKHVSLWKTWCDLKREYKDIDWPSQLEERQTYVSADTLGAQACSGGKCDIF